MKLSTHEFFSSRSIAGLVGAIAVLLAGTDAAAHLFNLQTDGADGEARGNNEYASWYNWSGSQHNSESLFLNLYPERHSYATQAFDVNTRIFGNDRQILRVSASADSSYRAGLSSILQPGYGKLQSASVSINGTELVQCTGSAGCTDVRALPMTEFYRASRTISFGLLGSGTLTSRVMGDISLNVSATSSSSQYLGESTGFFSRSTVDLVVSMHTFSRQSMSGTTTRDYRLLDIDIDTQEQARQATLSSTGLTTGNLLWSNREFVNVAQMDGRIAYTRSSPVNSKTVVLVDVPPFFWSGQFIDDVGSTTSF